MIASKWPTSDGAFAALVKDHADDIKGVAKSILRGLAGFAKSMLLLIIAIIVAGVLFIQAESGSRMMESLLDRLPCGGTRARRVVGHSGCRHCDGSSEGGEEDEETAYFLRSEEHRGHGDPPCGFLLEPGL